MAKRQKETFKNTCSCGHCGREFKSRRTTAKFCCDVCRQSAYLGRMRKAYNMMKASAEGKAT